MKSEAAASSSTYSQLAPQTPDIPSGSQFKYDGQDPTTVFESDSSDGPENSPGRRIVTKFGDKNCKIKHYYDFEASPDSFQRLIDNCKFYLQKVGKLLSPINDDQDIAWMAIIWKNWSEIYMPESVLNKWDQITFVIWDVIMKYNCKGCLYQEYYLTNFGQAEDMVPQHRMKKLLEETLIKMNADVSVKNKAVKNIIEEALTQL